MQNEEEYTEGAPYKSTKTVLELMEELGITSEVEEGTAPVNENMPNGAIGWSATFSFEEREVTFYYYTGSVTKEDPTADEILSTVLIESGDSKSYYTFEEFCDEFGYNTDSRKAEKTYNAIRENAQKLQNFLGEHYEDFLEAD